MSVKDDIREVLKPYHDHSCHSTQAWIKGMTEPFPCDCSLLEATQAIIKIIEEDVIGEDICTCGCDFGDACLCKQDRALRESQREKLKIDDTVDILDDMETE